MKIVIVEDAAPIREGMRKIIQKLDASYEVAGMACDGIEGLKMIEKICPDLVIMDIQMPDMDGLTMLLEVRRLKINCRVIVITAYSDFNYAKQAIELGIENYLLKPIRIPELKKALHQVEESLLREVRQEDIYTLKYIFHGSLSGHLEMDEQLRRIVWEKYGFRPEDQMGIFLIWLGDKYMEYRDALARLLENLDVNSSDFHSYLIEIEEHQMFAVIIYHMEENKDTRIYLRKSVIPMLAANLGHHAVFGWGYSRGLGGLKDTMRQVTESLDWNLALGEDALICAEEISAVKTEPLKYPLELEQRLKHAIAHKDEDEYKQCFKLFGSVCKETLHHPKEIKEACLRYCITVMNTAKEYGSFQEAFSAQDLFKSVAESVTWDEIASVLRYIFKQLALESENAQGETSMLIQKAQSLMQEYYNQGITLEETARKLHVTDEYLSALFKRETGKTFTETIRAYRIDKIKKLLLESDLKLNQIAVMTGYSDPKYMSKVFKDEVGILPAEYRKMNI